LNRKIELIIKEKEGDSKGWMGEKKRGAEMRTAARSSNDPGVLVGGVRVNAGEVSEKGGPPSVGGSRRAMFQSAAWRKNTQKEREKGDGDHTRVFPEKKG